MKQIKISTLFILSAVVLFTACTKKLDLTPTNDLDPEKVYKDAAGYKGALAKVYGAFALTGNSGPAGNADIQGIDEGTSDFFRLFWKAQELPTDEAVVAWGDPGIQDFHNMNWTTENPMTKGLYYRSMMQITYANDFIRQADDSKLAARGISGADADAVRLMKNEARYLRAFQFWVMMDLFGKAPFATEATIPGGALPREASRAQLFSYVESELKALESLLPTAKANEYGRADRAAAQALLARVYLNAGVYTGTPRYSDAADYAKKVIDIAGFSITSVDYRHLFLADNHSNASENIFTINFDGSKTQNFGGTTFLTHASMGGSMNASDHGIDFAWGGIRTTKALPLLFPDVTGTADRRAQFYTSGQNLEINSLTTFTDGYAVTKYRNKTKTGTNGVNNTFVDIDMPLFRLPEMYLIYAEAFTRGAATATAANALNYVNIIRTRAYGGSTGNITAAQLTTDFILDERARELYWEGHRRTDLIRYNKFVEGTYLWPWKGGVAAGTSVLAFRKLYPIPPSDLAANPNMSKNLGY